MAGRNTELTAEPTDEAPEVFATLEAYQATEFDIRAKALELAVHAAQFDSVDAELAAAEKYRAFLANDGQPVTNDHA